MPPADALNDQVTPLWRTPYAAQLQAKRADMVAALCKIGKALAQPKPAWAVAAMRARRGLVCPLAAVAPSPVTHDYRNKCEFTFGRDPAGALVCGFLLGAWQDGILTVLPPTACVHVPAQAKALCAAFEAFARASGHEAYDRVTHAGVWRGLLTRTTATGEAMARVMVTDAGLGADALATLEQRLAADMAARVAEGLPLQCLLLQVNNTKVRAYTGGGGTRMAARARAPVAHSYHTVWARPAPLTAGRAQPCCLASRSSTKPWPASASRFRRRPSSKVPPTARALGRQGRAGG